jgi:GntR family transcriptional regulator
MLPLTSSHIRKGSPVPYYEQLKRLLLRAIEEKGLEQGAILPSEAELCEAYGVSRTVVRQALGDLVNDGRLYRIRGKGTFVARNAPRAQFMESTLGFFEEPPQDTDNVIRKVLRCDHTEPPPEIAALLAQEPGAGCIGIERLRMVDDDPVSYSRHYLPTRIRPNLLEDVRGFDHAHRSIYEFLEDVCGVEIYSGHRTLEAVATPRDIAKLLELKTGAPALFVRSVSRDISGRPVECFEAWHRGDRAQFDIDVAGRPRSATLI